MMLRILITLLSLGLFSVSQEIVPDSYLLNEDDRQKAYLDVAKGFAEAKTVDDALPYIAATNKEGFKAAFEKYHFSKKMSIKGECYVFTHNMNQYALVRKSPNNKAAPLLFLAWHGDMEAPKVEWKATYGWGAMSWEQFLKEKPEIPIEMRLTAKKGNYYNYEFSNESVWQCINFYLEDVEEVMYAYIRRDNFKYKLLMSEIHKKGASSITAKLAYPEGDKHQNQVELVEMLSETWFDIK